MTRRKTDGKRIVDGLFRSLYGYGPYENQRLSRRVNRLIRKRMGEAWEEGWLDQYNDRRRLNENPYRGGEEEMTRPLAACVAVAAYAMMWVCAVWEARL